MNITFDHIVHFTQQPEKAMQAFQEQGFKAFKGGNHPNWGTHNCLCYFNNLAYIEWIGIKDLEVASQSDNLLIQQIYSDSTSVGEGFTQLAFRTNQIDELANLLKNKQYNVIGPVAGSRKRDDGTTLTWSMLFIKDDFRYPFFIQWGQPDEIREKTMAEWMKHPVGPTSMSTIHLSSPDPGTALKKFAHLFDQSEADLKGYTLSIGGILLKFHNHEGPVKPFQCDLITPALETQIEVCSGRYTLSKTVTQR
jgi:hypothetical protein